MRVVNSTKDCHASGAPRASPESPLASARRHSGAEKVRVLVRIRPRNEREYRQNDDEPSLYPQIDGDDLPTRLMVNRHGRRRAFLFDGVLAPEMTQHQVYQQAVQPTAIDALFQGYNLTILAYGQTGSGKTFTMSGGVEEVAAAVPLSGPLEHYGLILRAAHDLFAAQQHHDHVTIQLSYLEIYNDELRDLLQDGNSTMPLKMRDTGSGGVTVPGLQQWTVESVQQAWQYIQLAGARRTTGSTRLNARSSRSHALCTFTITTAHCSAQLVLVDLAGSERIKDTGVVGAQQQESININKDLFVLGKVVSLLAATDGGTTAIHIPYRDSKLTRLLRDSLGGKCHLHAAIGGPFLLTRFSR
jgi:Kinesin motor domain